MEDIRIKTGISKLDLKIQGGFPSPSIILIIGHAGSGKTVFSFQYLFECISHREKCLYFSTLSEPVSSLIKFGSNFFFFKPTQVGKRLYIIDMSEDMRDFTNAKDCLNYFINKIEKFKISRVVIDPINPLQLFLTDIKEYRLFLFEFSRYVKRKDLQVVITAELHGVDNFHCHESYISDGTLLFQISQKNQATFREMTIIKMRGTNHILEPFRYFITKNGIKLKMKNKEDFLEV